MTKRIFHSGVLTIGSSIHLLFLLFFIACLPARMLVTHTHIPRIRLVMQIDKRTKPSICKHVDLLNGISLLFMKIQARLLVDRLINRLIDVKRDALEVETTVLRKHCMIKAANR